jgi:hypothetical protein
MQEARITQKLALVLTLYGCYIIILIVISGYVKFERLRRVLLIVLVPFFLWEGDGMATKFYFDFKDVFHAGRMGFKGKKILMHFFGLMLGYIIYELLIYISLTGSGSAGEFWQRYGLCPIFFKSGMSFPVPTIISAIIGAIIWLIIYLLFSTAVCKVAVEELRGDDFYSMREALKFAVKNGKSIYVSILGLIAISLFCLFWPSLFGLIDNIPKIEQAAEHFGTPLTTFLTIPIYFLGLFMVLTLIACMFSLYLIPAIVAVTGEDTLETIYQLYSTIWNQPWRLVIYNKLLWFIAFLGGIIFAAISFVALYMAFLPSILLAKQESFYFADVVARALKIVGAGCLVQIIPGANITSSMPWTLDLSTFFLFVSLIMIGAIVTAYPLAINSCGQTIIYVILRKKITDENMLEVAEEEPLEEKVEEKSSEEQQTETSQEKSE